MQGTKRRAELADFLRTRKERLQPADVGLPGGGRRRTPGLRREEVALLSGVSVTWYTSLEEGRDIRASGEVLKALARVLRLDGTERAHLYALAHGPEPSQPPMPDESLDPHLARVLDLVEGSPAYVTGRRWDILGYNRMAATVLAEFTDLPPGRQNLLRWMFADPGAQRVLADWQTEAQALLARFRLAADHHAGDPQFAELIDELRAVSPQLRAWWPRHDIRSRRSDAKLLHHPSVGTFAVQPTVLQGELTSNQKLVIYAAKPHSPDAAKLRHLAGLRR
jgi:transcriptional regulator with XRE-family HTH domain